MIYRMTHATIYVSDIGEAVDFYRDKLGVTGIRTAEEFPDYVELPTEGATIALVRPAEGSAGEGQAGGRVTGPRLPSPTSGHSTRSSSARASCSHSQSAEQPWGGLMATLVDPDGNALSLPSPLASQYRQRRPVSPTDTIWSS